LQAGDCESPSGQIKLVATNQAHFIRAYTSHEIVPLLDDRMKSEFLSLIATCGVTVATAPMENTLVPRRFPSSETCLLSRQWID
jgi:hypothetical protein